MTRDLSPSPRRLRAMFVACLLLGVSAAGQQLVRQGVPGKPAQVLGETGQWTTSLLLASDAEVQIYTSDLTDPDWLKQNYREFMNRGSYTLTLFSLYRTTAACQQNQTGWGLGDREHLDACTNTGGYRVRRVRIDRDARSATLLMTAMLDPDGNADAVSTQDDGAFRTWDQLDGSTQLAIRKANTLVGEQMRRLDKRMQSSR